MRHSKYLFEIDIFRQLRSSCQAFQSTPQTTLSVFCFLWLSKRSFSIFVFFSRCRLGPRQRLLLSFSKARILFVSTHRSTLSAGCKSLTQIGGEWPNGVTGCMSWLALRTLWCRRPTFALNLGWIPDNHYWACGMVNKVVGNAAKNCASHFAETTCSRDDHYGGSLISNLADHFTWLSSCCTHCSWNLHNNKDVSYYQNCNFWQIIKKIIIKISNQLIFSYFFTVHISKFSMAGFCIS